MIKFPGIQDFFLASLPSAEFIKNVCAQYVDFMKNTSQIRNKVIQYHPSLYGIDPNDLNMAFTLASLTVLAKKQG